MVSTSTEQLLINLQSTIKQLEMSIEEKNKEIQNLRDLIYRLQEIKGF